MKQNATLFYSLLLVVGDFLALVGAFSVAYILRVKYDTRPLLEQIPAETYVYGFLAVLPLWILMQGFIGLYRREVYENRFREFGRLVLGSFLGMLVIIGYDFIIDGSLFPARLVAVYGLILSFGFLVIFRALARLLRSSLFSVGYGVANVLIVGDGTFSESIVSELENTRRSGHKIVGIVSGSSSKHRRFETFSEAIESVGEHNIHSIIQTELYKKSELNDEIMVYAQTHHIAYKFIPGNNELFVGNIEVELFRGTPVVTVHQTPLIGWGSIVKRIFDVFISCILLILLSPIILIISIIQKIVAPNASIIFRQQRLTQFNREFTAFKFQTMNPKISGLSAEEDFKKMGRPDLIQKFRDGGDHLENDPRITPFGKLLRLTSLDEVPQLVNVLRGDISLVGPRALIPSELKDYKKRHNILSIKSGLTGLAQVSGRKNLDFEERRKLDLYYVQNWSFWLDVIILLRTLRAVINGIGAK